MEFLKLKQLPLVHFIIGMHLGDIHIAFTYKQLSCNATITGVKFVGYS